MKDLKNFFQPGSIAVIGASRNPNKVGHVLFKNIIEGGFKHEVFPINPNTDLILNKKVYPSILKVEKKVDLAIIAVPAESVLKTVQECNKKNIKNLLIITSGFKEIGRVDLEEKLQIFLKKNKINCIGVNCLGIYDSYNKLDALFIPRYRLKRPEPGTISFVCQSGAIGAAILDIATEQGHKFSKFISYGNATDIDESDLLEYLSHDEKTKVICLYIEGIKNGKKFFETIKKVSKIKPIIALKGGLTKQGSQAALSHTGALAGDKEVFFGIFAQTKVIKTDSLEEMFNTASLIEKNLSFKGNRIQIITNGGGYGILSIDEIAQSKNLALASLSEKTIKELRKNLPKIIKIHNPLDLLGDATTERYKVALENCIKDKNIDAILLIVLYQTPLITTDIVEIISESHMETKKPIIIVSTGAEFTQTLSRALEKNGLPTFTYPTNAINAIDKVVWYQEKMKSKEKL
ncbi:CoA-binding protein [Candidatus Pacearchaeota archaeon]|nr:CoA-binding protein [Candidatus Pacearchaeota archaeon]